MSVVRFLKDEVAAAVGRGVQQCVLIGTSHIWRDTWKELSNQYLGIVAIDDDPAVEPLATTLARSSFDRLRASLFVWLGGTGSQTIDATLARLSFIASLPEGSAVVLSYAADRTGPPSMDTALDPLASHICGDRGLARHIIQPQALQVMLSALGFRKIADHAEDEWCAFSGHLVSAAV